MKRVATYGTWISPITAESVATGSRRVSEPVFAGQYLYWVESRPEDKGRCVIVRQGPSGLIEDVLPSPWSARSKVHEYGGGVYALWNNTLYFVNAADQQIYAMDVDTREPAALTAEPTCRFADLVVDPHHRRLIAVCEDHSPYRNSPLENSSPRGLPDNRLICVALDDQRLVCLASGHDFYASPTLSPCGRWLAYLTWDHPAMPWDATRLWLQPVDNELQPTNNGLQPADNAAMPICIAGHQTPESLFQPQWSPQGALHWVSDRSGWWNLYRVEAAQIEAASPGLSVSARPVLPMDAEFATPQWTFRMSTYGCVNEDTLFATWSQRGEWSAGYLRRDPGTDRWHCEQLCTDLCSISNVRVQAEGIALAGASRTTATQVYRVEGTQLTAAPTGSSERGSFGKVSGGDIARAQALEFPIRDADMCGHAFFYPPTNAEFEGPEDSRPPVIVIGHGGPTGAADCSLNHKIQYWTSRGFAVLDVNYRGSTGFGRTYRRALYSQWGVADVEDMVAAVTQAIELGWVNPRQCIIRGSSAGGYTVLCALTDSRVFSAGVSLYGIGDLEALVADTHKFEAHYVDALIGPYPAMKATYRKRSPIHKVDRIQCPLLVFQGLEDKVVPPNQAEAMVNAVRRRGLPVACVVYADEAHGFRQAANIAHQLAVELEFYRRIFGWPAIEDSPHLDIYNLAT